MQKKATLILIALSLVFTAACSSAAKYTPDEVSQLQEKAEAEASAAHEHANARLDVYAQLAEGTVTVDTSASKLEWYGSKVSGGHDGGFADYQGTVSFNTKGEVGKIEFTVDVNSIYSDVEQLTEHLKSADFFEVETYPTATFVSTNIVANSAELDEYTITGDMTIKGETVSITFPAKVAVQEGKLHTSAEFNINRFDYGITYEGKADDLINKEVLLKLNFVADLPAVTLN